MTLHTKIKLILTEESLTFIKLIYMLNEKYNTNYTAPNLHKKIKNETIKYREVEMILDILGYNLDWTKR